MSKLSSYGDIMFTLATSKIILTYHTTAVLEYISQWDQEKEMCTFKLLL